jgi:hypothetical protein
MTVFDDLSARVRLLTDNITAVERAGTPVDELVGERLDSLARATADFRHAPFRLTHGNSAAMVERFTLGFAGTYFPKETRSLIEQSVRDTAGPGTRMSSQQKATTLADLQGQLRIAEARLEQHRREREASGAEVMPRSGNPGVYLLTDSDLARAVAGLPPEEIVPPDPDNPGGADVFGASAGHI